MPLQHPLSQILPHTLLCLLCSVVAVSCLQGIGHAADGLQDALPAATATHDEKKKINWYSAKQLTFEGQGFSETKAPYDRLPAKEEKTVRKAVWGLSRHSAGMCVRFVTNATTLFARWTLTSPRLEMVHMPATGVSGLDLYVKTDAGKWHWVAIGRPSAQKNSVTLVKDMLAGTREFMVYLPLYNGVSMVEIGIPDTAEIATAAPRKLKPIVFYGTSITHGACASRTGMCHPAIIGRRFDAPVINLGFSGNGRMEAEVAKLMAEIDASVYVIDCLPNISAATVTARIEPLVKILREKHPTTPIVLVEDRNYADAFIIPAKKKRNEDSQAALKVVFDRLKKQGDKNLYYLEAEKLLNDDGDGTVDSSHPNDYGFMQHADAFEELLKPILK